MPTLHYIGTTTVVHCEGPLKNPLGVLQYQMFNCLLGLCSQFVTGHLSFCFGRQDNEVLQCPGLDPSVFMSFNISTNLSTSSQTLPTSSFVRLNMYLFFKVALAMTPHHILMCVLFIFLLLMGKLRSGGLPFFFQIPDSRAVLAFWAKDLYMLV